jgi:uncharacterized protein (DUF4415 family)
MRNPNKAREIIVDVTEKEYRADLARGLQVDEVLQPGRHKFKRGGFLIRHGLKSEQTPGPVKVRISINLDLDVLTYFKRRAAQPNAAPYQTQINNALRAVMEGEQKAVSASLPSHAEALLADRRFIEAVAKRVQVRSPTNRKRNRHAA